MPKTLIIFYFFKRGKEPASTVNPTVVTDQAKSTVSGITEHKISGAKKGTEKLAG